MDDYIFFILIGALVIMLIILLMTKRNKIYKSKEKNIIVKNIINLGAKEKILLLEVHDVNILIGATANHIETLYLYNKASIDNLEKSQRKEPNVRFTEDVNGTELKSLQ